MTAEILESVMLICFGFSWPTSVVKNIRAKSAKSMSLPFILLIITGYIAGIAGKIVSGNISYVLIVYAINLLFVIANLAVYFINRRYDKKREKSATVSVSPARPDFELDERIQKRGVDNLR